MESAVEIASRPAGGPPVHPEPKPVLPLAVDAAEQPKSRKRYLILGAVTLAVVVAAGGWSLLTAGRESTDDAQVAADLVPIGHNASDDIGVGLSVFTDYEEGGFNIFLL